MTFGSRYFSARGAGKPPRLKTFESTGQAKSSATRVQAISKNPPFLCGYPLIMHAPKTRNPQRSMIGTIVRHLADLHSAFHEGYEVIRCSVEQESEGRKL